MHEGDPFHPCSGMVERNVISSGWSCDCNVLSQTSRIFWLPADALLTDGPCDTAKWVLRGVFLGQIIRGALRMVAYLWLWHISLSHWRDFFQTFPFWEAKTIWQFLLLSLPEGQVTICGHTWVCYKSSSRIWPLFPSAGKTDVEWDGVFPRITATSFLLALFYCIFKGNVRGIT